MTGGLPRRTGALLLAAFLTACGEGRPTEIVVRLSSDLQVPAELDGLGLKVEYWGALRFDQSYDLDPARPGAVSIPATVGIVPGDGPRQPVTIRAAGTKDGHPLLTRTARVSFAAERILLLELPLERSCIGVSCLAEETCESGQCTPIDVDPHGLPDY